MSLWRILREPILEETRQNLARSRARVPVPLQGPRQMLGRGGNGCGATIGAMPRCDFACVGCYLGEEANRIPPAPLAEIKAQMRALRPTLGNAGNLQLTDGEVTLRPVDEVIELLRYARSLGLIPMLMTHGDAFRRRPGLLERLVLEGGLVEVSIHIDTTQRGRLGEDYRHARTEEALMPLREEFARMLRAVARTTGRPLRPATTMTVTADNLAGVPAVIRWLTHNADIFRLVSFQPVAQVGRTVEGLGGGVSVEALWRKIAEGLGGSAEQLEWLERSYVHVGHPDCTRYLPGMVSCDQGRAPAFHPARTEGEASARFYDGFLERFGGVSFRLDTPLEKAVRMVALAAREPRFVLGGLGPYLRLLARQADPAHPLRFLWRLLRRRARLRSLVIVSHHFMSRAEVDTPRGRERLDLCVFHVPVHGRLVPMCEVNTMGVREAYYAELSRSRGEAPVAAPAG
ncbi:MAG: radical SAM protein [Gemmatimonadetes bacterium]|nr:radical SAM protein [Gemmatimonadota bacterium]MBK7717273.1 radical SAM protein [Gemmatimonadota bacterium]MBK9691790.1 radical SAM protein [Gemmatimonadota bacterium]